MNVSTKASSGGDLSRSLPTPAAVIDLPRLKRNTALMAKRAHAHGVHLRPHVKTHKCVEAARYQVADHFGGIAVSTLAEAEYFARAGFTDITYAVPLSPGRVAKACALSQSIEVLHVLVDSAAAVLALEREAADRQIVVSVLIKVDCGYHRAGLLPEDPALVSLAQQIHSLDALHFQGLLTHAGHSYDCVGVDAIRRVAEQERSMAVQAADRLREANLPVATVSVGSTPTMAVVENLEGITEIRPGNYALFDHFQADIGSCSQDDIALSVLTEIIGVYPERNTLLIDAGALAMSKDPGATHATGAHTFGCVCDLAGRPIPDMKLIGLSQEHGKLSTPNAHQYSIGDRLRILPNHSCLVTALYDVIHIQDGQEIIDAWHPVRGW